MIVPEGWLKDEDDQFSAFKGPEELERPIL